MWDLEERKFASIYQCHCVACKPVIMRNFSNQLGWKPGIIKWRRLVIFLLEEIACTSCNYDCYNFAQKKMIGGVIIFAVCI